MRFEDELRQKLISAHLSVYGNFESIFLKTLEANALTKTKIVRANNKPHVNEELRRAMTRRSTLKKVASKSKREEDVRKYKDQRNLVVKLNVKAKNQHFMSIQAKTIDNEETFWKTVKPLFSNRNPMREKITLIENGKILSNEFANITDNFDIDPRFKEVHEQLTIEEVVLRAIDKYKDHPSIRVINQHVTSNGNTLKFSRVSPTEVMK